MVTFTDPRHDPTQRGIEAIEALKAAAGLSGDVKAMTLIADATGEPARLVVTYTDDAVGVVPLSASRASQALELGRNVLIALGIAGPHASVELVATSPGPVQLVLKRYVQKSQLEAIVGVVGDALSRERPQEHPVASR